MNTRSVNSAAGVILAAMQQNRTPAGIALALEAAGLLMSPEAAKDMASVSTDAVSVAERAVEELRREHEESARLRSRLAELEAELAKYVGIEPTVADELAYASRVVAAVDALRLPESLKVDSIEAQYRCGYVHALADMRTALEMPQLGAAP
ncbi:hypothetical protein [Streptomyces spinosus]|uniref:hypothetical protein n=1 Tax=Streptomyces spinosus TaxID=2872623 RepID=UPI001CEDBE7D|nr:hypothetical protein [Streptomyces spinosus]